MQIVEDPAFHRLMKTGRPHYRIPSSRTVARDVHVVFNRVKERIANMLQVSFFFLKKRSIKKTYIYKVI